MSKPSVAVLGPGAVGGFLSVLLARHGVEVTCLTREPVVEAIHRDGLRLESGTYGDLVMRPRAAAQLEEQPDIVLVTVKATTLVEAMERVDPAQAARAVIVPLLNGVEHMEPLRQRYGARVLAASIGHVQVIRRSATHIVHSTASAEIELASDGDVPKDRVLAVARLLQEAGVPTTVREHEVEVLWGKLVRLAPLACVTSASRRPLGEIQSDPSWRAQLEACIREAAAVATAEGLSLEAEEVIAQVEGFPAHLSTSTQRDIAAGKPSELDAIAGAVVRAGARHGIACPVMQRLMSTIETGLVRLDTTRTARTKVAG